MTDARDAVWIGAADLSAVLTSSNPPAVLHVEDGEDGADYGGGHVPGAVLTDLSADFAAPPDGILGRRPLPDLADLRARAHRWGIRAGQPVVTYDTGGGTHASRAWWVLRWAGIEDVRILDGGLAAWRAGGGAVATDAPAPTGGDVVLRGGGLPVLTADEAAAVARDGILLDARGAAAYAEGHLPGARSAPASGNLLTDGTLRDAASLRARFAGLGVRDGVPVSASCGSGVSATHLVAALASIGIPAALYAPSFSGWTTDPGRPVATGPEPG